WRTAAVVACTLPCWHTFVIPGSQSFLQGKALQARAALTGANKINTRTFNMNSAPLNDAGTMTRGVGFGKTPSQAQAASPPPAATKIHKRSTLTSDEVAKLRGPNVESSEEAKRELLHLLPRLTDPGKQKYRVEYLVQMLEAGYTPIHTFEFFNFGVQGDWHLAYSNARMGMPDPRLVVRELYQRVEPLEKTGTLTNFVGWELLEEERCQGMLEVSCNYELDPRGWMNVTLVDHRVRLGSKMPQDPKGLVQLLQMGIPYEIFAPGEHMFGTSVSVRAFS
ncbi:unnamed protein product, partial [Discosporangium mesarthrocarpum]